MALYSYGVRHGLAGEAEELQEVAAVGRPHLFLASFSEHADGQRRGPVPIWKESKDASRRDLSDAALRFDLALGVRRRHAPKRRLKIGAC